MIRSYILKNNPSVDAESIEFKTLVDLFAKQLLNNEGYMSADDYNFSVDHYNNCRLIAGYITATKLPHLFKDGYKKILRQLNNTARNREECRRRNELVELDPFRRHCGYFSE